MDTPLHNVSLFTVASRMTNPAFRFPSFYHSSAEADRNITDYSGNKPMDYLTHQTTVSASTYNSEYTHQLYNHSADCARAPAVAESLADNFAGATGTIKSRRTSATVRSSTLHRLRSHRKRFATVDPKAGGGGGIAPLLMPTPLPGRRGGSDGAAGGSGSGAGLATSRSMVDTTTAGHSLLSSGSESSMLTASADQDRRGSMFGATQKASKRANRMYQSFLFRGKGATASKAD